MSLTTPDDDDLPPPYSSHPASPFPGQTRPANTPDDVHLPTALTAPFTSSLTAHLQNLPSRMRAAQQARSTAQATRDLDLVTLLVPHIEAFLARLGGHNGNRGSTVSPVAELTLVPAAAVPCGWALSGAAERRREGDVVRLVRVDGIDEPRGDKKDRADSRGPPSDEEEEGEKKFAGSAKEFNSWSWWDDEETGAGSSTATGKDVMWWRDERMAKRLASYLQPKAPVPQPKVERRYVQAAIQQPKAEEKGWSWGRRKTVWSSPSPVLAPPTPSPSGKTREMLGEGGDASPFGLQAGQMEDRVRMTVRGDEVTFRRENEFGVWESLSGFGIVAVVKMKRP